MKFIRRFARHIRDGFEGVGRHLGMSLSSSTAVTITLLLIGFFLVLTANLYSLTVEIEGSISLSALVSYDAEDQIDAIKSKISVIDGVEEVVYQNKDKEFDFYVSMYPEMAEFYEIYREENPFHDAFIISLKDGTYISSVKKRLETITGIDSVHDGGSNTYLLVTLLEKVRIFGTAVVGCLALLAIYLIYNTIKITIASRSDEISIMKTVGARNGYIRAAFLVEGIVIGVLGSILPIAGIWAGYVYLYQYTNGVLFAAFTLIKPYPFIMYVSGLLLATAVVVGFIGSYISVWRHLRRSR